MDNYKRSKLHPQNVEKYTPMKEYKMVYIP
jgi:hypothetical protein